MERNGLLSTDIRVLQTLRMLTQKGAKISAHSSPLWDDKTPRRKVHLHGIRIKGTRQRLLFD